MEHIEKKPTSEVLIERWLLPRGTVLEILDRLPESGAGYRVWPGGFSTLEMVNHLAEETEMFMAVALDRPEQLAPRSTTLANAHNLLARQYDALTDEIRARSEEDLQKLVTMTRFNLTLPAAEMIQLHISHEVHHNGQLLYHCRLLNIEPPFFMHRLHSFASEGNWK